MEKENKWLNIPENIDDYQGFIYIIINRVSGKFYFGQKNFWRIAKLAPLKGRTKAEKERRAKLTGRKRHVKKETDWRNYWGSSEALLTDIEKLGQKNFFRIILFPVSGKAVMNYIELYLQMYYNVLFNPKCYNNIINIRTNANMVASKKEEIQ